MKLLVLTTRLFGTPTSGGEICTARLLDGLAQAGHDLVLAGRGDDAAARVWARQVVSLGPVEPPFEGQPLSRRLQAVAGALVRGLPITAHRQGGPHLAARVAPLLRDCDAVIVDHLQVWPWLGRQAGKPVMLVQHNVESDNYVRQRRAANRGYRGNPKARPFTRFVMGREAQKLRALEFEALARARVVACLADGDAERLLELARQARRPAQARVQVLPGFPLAREPAIGRRARATPTVGLIGTWTWAPNREALRWFIDQVWPRLARQARLVLAGSGLDGLSLPDGTLVLGRVGTVREFLEATDLIAIPSLSGSGVQEKAIEALATGLPVVATPHALRGLGPELPPNVCMASGAVPFAAACLQGLSTIGAADAGAWNAAIDRWCALRQQQYRDSLALCLRELHGAPAGEPAAWQPQTAGTA